MASHSFGASCHSSINRGTAPFNRRLGFSSDMVIFCSFLSGSSIYKTLAENCSAVVVLPHHLGPSIKTAPFPSSFRFSISSATLFLYFFTQDASSPLILPILCAKPFKKATFFRWLVKYFSDDWRDFIPLIVPVKESSHESNTSTSPTSLPSSSSGTDTYVSNRKSTIFFCRMPPRLMRSSVSVDNTSFS